LSYSFDFDLSVMPRDFFDEVTRAAESIRKDISPALAAKKIEAKYKMHRKMGLSQSRAMLIIKDLLEIERLNIENRKKFAGVKKKALLLPHCSRKHMDYRCKAKFDAGLSSYFCRACSPDCPVNLATQVAGGSGYDVYILPGGSCLRKLLSKKKYKGIFGVACCEEMKLASTLLAGTGISLVGLSLLKNGCVETKFDVETLKKRLKG